MSYPKSPSLNLRSHCTSIEAIKYWSILFCCRLFRVQRPLPSSALSLSTFCTAGTGSIRSWDISSKGRFIQGTVRSREVASKESIRQGTHDRRKNPRDATVGGHIVMAWHAQTTYLLPVHCKKWKIQKNLNVTQKAKEANYL